LPLATKEKVSSSSVMRCLEINDTDGSPRCEACVVCQRCRIIDGVCDVADDVCDVVDFVSNVEVMKDC
jgi:hypothetical protein